MIERAVLLCPTPVIPVAALGLGATRELSAPYGASELDVDALQRSRLSEALAPTGWNISRTAAALGVTRNTVRARIARYGLRSMPDADSAALPPRAATRAVEAEAPIATPSLREAGVPRGPSIAVVPFRVVNEEEVKSYLGDGIVEDIVGALASLRELVVISRSSTLRYRGYQLNRDDFSQARTWLDKAIALTDIAQHRADDALDTR